MQDKKLTERKRLLYSKWLKHIGSWESSGQMKQDYCIAHNLSFDAFKKPYTKYKQATRKTQQSPGHFIPVQLTDITKPQAIELIFPGGLLIKIPPSLSLHSVFKSLKIYL